MADLVTALTPPRAVWIMVPAAHAGATADALVEMMDPGDVVIDGGNSYYRDDVERAGRYEASGVHYVGVGTSGGVFGLERGFCLMIGGEAEVVSRLDPIFAALAPGVDAAARTPGRGTGPAGTAEAGYLHCGPVGAGHFVKMLPDGIASALMAAYAEGLGVLAHANAGAVDARPTPRPRRSAIRRSTGSTSISPRSPRCGAEAASSRRGCCWLYRIAANCAFDVLRRRQRRDDRLESLDGEDAPEPQAEAPGPDRLALGGDVRRHLETALERMSPRERAAFVLRHFEGRSVKEIELALEMDTTAVKQSVCRAVRKAREVLLPLTGAAS